MSAKSLFILFLMFCASSVMACSCKRTSTETVAYLSNYNLTKLEIQSPTLLERIAAFKTSRSDSNRLKVKVVENIKGTYEYNFVDVETNIDGGGCGVKIDYGQQVYAINFKDKNGAWSHSISVCNTVSEKFAEIVKDNIKNPSSDYKSVDKKNWSLLSTNRTQSFYADTAHVTKDELGSKIWLLMNDSDTKAVVKSKKILVHIACHRKLYSHSHEIHFSEANARGEPLFTSHDGSTEQFLWNDITVQYEKLLRYVC